MKKKIVISEKVTAVMLAAAMAISMTACGSPAKDMQGAAETAADEETSTVETAADRETSAVETVSEIAGNTTESTENAATDAEILVAEDPDTEITASNENTDIKVTVEDQKEEKKNDAGEVLVTISVQKATIEDSGYDALQKVLDQQSADTYELAQEAWGDMQTFLEDSDWETTGSLYAIEDTISMKRGDDRIFSYVTTDYSYLGGAHPNFVYNGYNYDTKTGKRLTLRDVTEDYDSLYAQVLDTLRAFQEEQEDFMFFEDYEDTVKEMFYGFSAEEDLEDSGMTDADREEISDTAGTASDIDNIQWYLTDNELVVIFNRYDIAAYVFGPTAVKIPFETGLVKEIYS